MKGSLLDQGEYYKYLYFEFPYHLFNIVAFIVIMQWIQIWAVLNQVNEDPSKKMGLIQRVIRFCRRTFFEDKQYYVFLYGVVILLLSLLIIDTVLLSIDQLLSKDNLKRIFQQTQIHLFAQYLIRAFTLILMISGIVITIEYFIMYILIRIEFLKLPKESRRALLCNMHAFFIMMTILLGSRTIYYIVFRFKDFRYETTSEIENKQLVFIYVQEIFFNFVVFYNLVLKFYHDERFEENIQKCKERSSKKNASFNNDEDQLDKTSENLLNKTNSPEQVRQDKENKLQNFEATREDRIRTLTEDEDEEGKGLSYNSQDGFQNYQQPMYSPGSLKRKTTQNFNGSLGLSSNPQFSVKNLRTNERQDSLMESKENNKTESDLQKHIAEIQTEQSQRDLSQGQFQNSNQINQLQDYANQNPHYRMTTQLSNYQDNNSIKANNTTNSFVIQTEQSQAYQESYQKL
ncbi:UNKNOWN [Stylonychia lemnae]|uniref:Transmembrane protein n=1 Tax=Stylonychia lemnae TaxID=5949 RepID=A0A078B3E2_STYLE|nr:UNKNOWN [Stylonychia lemnae]|eukprot:CDW88023.1 UNKNOWN [Stylonychia lemnae]